MIVIKTVALSNVKAADLELASPHFAGILEVTLRGFSFYIVGSQGLTRWTCQERNVKTYPDNQKYPFDAISDLKEFVRTCVAVYQEEAALPEFLSDADVKDLEASSKPLQVSLSALVEGVSATGNLFFTKKTMKFFGDTLGNWGTRLVSIVVAEGEQPEWLVELYRKQPVKHNTQTSSYWNPKTFKRVHMPC